MQTKEDVNEEVADLRAELAYMQRREVGLQQYCRQVLRDVYAERDQAKASGIAFGALMCISIQGIYVRPNDGTLVMQKATSNREAALEDEAVERLGA